MLQIYNNQNSNQNRYIGQWNWIVCSWIVYSWLLYQILVFCICMGLFQGSQFYSVGQCVCFYASTYTVCIFESCSDSRSQKFSLLKKKKKKMATVWVDGHVHLIVVIIILQCICLCHVLIPQSYAMLNVIFISVKLGGGYNGFHSPNISTLIKLLEFWYVRPA